MRGKFEKMVRFVAFCIVLALSAINSSAKEWRGIVPMRSTRADVERLLGPPGEHGRYQFENERGYVEYATGSCHDKNNCLCFIPEDTVLNVYVQLETFLRFSSIKLNKRNYEK